MTVPAPPALVLRSRPSDDTGMAPVYSCGPDRVKSTLSRA